MLANGTKMFASKQNVGYASKMLANSLILKNANKKNSIKKNISKIPI